MIPLRTCAGIGASPGRLSVTGACLKSENRNDSTNEDNATLVMVVVLLGYAVYLSFSGSSPEEALVFEQEEITNIAQQEPIARPPSPLPVHNLVDMSAIDSLKSELETLARTVSDSASLISKQTETADLQTNRIQQVMASLENNQTLLTELASDHRCRPRPPERYGRTET